MEFLVFGEDWGRHPSSSQHIISQLMHSYPVTWVNSIGLRQPSINRRDIVRIKEKLLAKFSAKNPTVDSSANSQENHQQTTPTHIVQPLVWPLAQHTGLKILNKLSLQRQLPKKRYQRVIWTALPSAIDLLSICDSDLVIYYCGDDFSALAGVDHQATAAAEQRLMLRADLIFACSPMLQAKLQQLNPQNPVILLPHGVSLSQFATPQPAPANINLKRTSIGFYGSIDQWLDQQLLRELAIQRPLINFYLLGPINTDISALADLNNIHLLPTQPHEQLARYLQHWDMAILPFKNTPQIQACNPLKLREYLAAGCPTISSDFPATQPYRSVIKTATTTEQWLQAIDHYSHWGRIERNHYQTQTRQLIAAETWQVRAKEVTDRISHQLKHKVS
ncbi:glycosyltransferase [Photobacterium sanguinicancri]|uniref:Glycosyl transferase family 1 n=1 Tax=Photobacterium sanguinicancri TaxID=875932 RepID=A0ABX4G1D9_9GAMM|nr:glycosyltransferase [Photobacterium sanguinicancri]OZS44420.1 glycosyl transferase family 1 [Photobacterium sanguinicancri]